MSNVNPENDDEFQCLIAKHSASRSPLVYGPISWVYLHHWSLRYPDKPNEHQKERARKYLDEFVSQEGCGTCIAHMRQYMKKVPIALDSRLALVEWMREAHNDVNRRNEKPEMSRSAFADMYIQRPRAFVVNWILDKQREEKKGGESLLTNSTDESIMEEVRQKQIDEQTARSRRLLCWAVPPIVILILLLLAWLTYVIWRRYSRTSQLRQLEEPAGGEDGDTFANDPRGGGG
jgi:hypothetical protein